MGVNSRSRVRFAVPSEALAGRFGLGVMRTVEDDQVQGIDTLAAVGVFVFIGVNT